MKRNKRTFGFTLVEIMIVVTIIGILASLAVPAFQRARWKALETSIRNNLRQIWGAAQQYMMENGVDQIAMECIVQWKNKAGTGTGNNAGYTSVIQQVANESYSSIKAFRGETITNDENTADSPSGADGVLYEDTTGLRVAVPPTSGSGCSRYVKLVL